MSPISIKRSLALFALVAVASISPSSAFFGLRGRPDDWEFPPLPETSERTPQQLMVSLSKGYQPRWTEYYTEKYGAGEVVSGVVYTWLSQTSDKTTPKTIFNKYSVQDLLDLNLIYRKEATLEEYDRRKQMCEDFNHEKISEEDWRIESSMAKTAEEKLLNQKYYLSDYCWATFGRFRIAVMDNIKSKVLKKLGKKDNDNLERFRSSLVDHYSNRRDRDMTWDEAFEEHVKSYDKEKFAELKAACSKLSPLAETYRVGEFPLLRYAYLSTDCKKINSM